MIKIKEYDKGEITLLTEDDEKIIITGKDVVELITMASTFTNFIQENTVGQQEDLNI